LGDNGQDFLDSPFTEWLLTCGEVTFTRAEVTEREAEANKQLPPEERIEVIDNHWAEERHQDGGASVCHMSLTLWGRRRVVCDVPGCAAVPVKCLPGTVYISQLTGPHHQAIHEKSATCELLVLDGHRLSVAFQFRTALFARNRSRNRNATPSPPAFFQALTSSFAASLAEIPLEFPTLAQCESILSAGTPRDADDEAAPLPKRPRQ
jgi:hypothetical protein